MLRIGLTGGIGSGKSTVAALLAGHGAEIIDVDAIAHQLTQPGGAAVAALVAAFGADILDTAGGLDRHRMRMRVFDAATAQPGARQRLETVLHPLIATESERRAAASSAAVQVFDVPLLVESGRWRQRVDRVCVVDCSEATQRQRVLQRPGWNAAMVDSVLARQASRTARRTCADAVLHNDGITREELALQVETLWNRWCAC